MGGNWPASCSTRIWDSAVEADLKQLSVLLSIHRRVDRAIDTKEMAAEISARLREELDYQREAAHIALYGAIFADTPAIIVPETIETLSTKRLLTMTWLDGKPVLSFKDNPLEDRKQSCRSHVSRVVVALKPIWRYSR